MERIDLPDPPYEGKKTVEDAIAQRKSHRSFADRPVSVDDIARLVWAAQGLTHERDGVQMRAAPSAGATFPLEVFLDVATGAEDIEAGRYRYDPADHVLERTGGPAHDAVTQAALDQPVVADAPTTLAITADYTRTTSQYPEHGIRYVHMEAGHAAENVQLVGTARRLHTCPVGAFDDVSLASALGLPDELDPLYLLPVGYPPE
jgi:SagB-type dehydrogenase family enzyme